MCLPRVYIIKISGDPQLIHTHITHTHSMMIILLTATISTVVFLFLLYIFLLFFILSPNTYEHLLCTNYIIGAGD